MKCYLFASALGLCFTQISAAIDAVPEPGLIIYGQIFSQSSPTETVAISAMAWASSVGGLGSAPSTATYPVPPSAIQDSAGYYVARVPFETPNPAGLAFTGSGVFDLVSSASDAHYVAFSLTPAIGGPARPARIKAVNGVANGGTPASQPTFYNWSDITAAKRGGMVRLDLFSEALPSDAFTLWMTDFLPGGGTNAGRTADADGDGMSNEQEFSAGTNPVSAGSVLRVVSFGSAGIAPIAIQWSSVGGKRYQVEKSADLGATWLPEGAVVTAATDTAFKNDIPKPVGPVKYFYRVRVVP